MFKKITTFAAALVLSIALVGCNSHEELIGKTVQLQNVKQSSGMVSDGWDATVAGPEGSVTIHISYASRYQNAIVTGAQATITATSQYGTVTATIGGQQVQAQIK